MELNPAPIESGWAQDSKMRPVIIWALWFQKVFNVLTGSVVAQTWTPIATGLTVVGVATLTGSFSRIGNVVTFKVSITTTGTTAATAGVTTVTLPFTAADTSICAAVDAGSYASYDNGIIPAATDTMYVPTWGATANEVIVTGTYRVTG